ncbi:MAG: PAS domain S-box protein, partial [Cyclobacteriaceae bacterium]|nr:PAS domain S-box protein [Cyclobacteriaceae bacterium]
GIGVVQDITARKKAETELREQEETLRTLLNAPLEVIMLVNRDGMVLSTNQGGANSFGMSIKEMIGQNIYQYMPEKVAQSRKSSAEKVFKTGKAIHFEDEREDQIFASSLYPVFDVSGEKVVNLAVFSSNITDRKVMQRELIKSEAKYRSLVDNALIGVFHTKTNGQIIFVNEALAQMYDYDGPGQMMSEEALLHWVDQKRREQFILTLQEYGSASNFEAETISQTGRHIHILMSATLEAEDISGMVMDITEQKKIDFEILDYQKRLKELAQELTLSEEKIRKQIAVDLHDHVGQMLSSSRMQLASIIEMEENPELESRIENISQALLKAIQSTRAAIFDLSPPQLNEIGLYAAVHDWMKEQIERKHGINTIFTGEQVKFHLEENARILIFRSIKELMMNTVKHARASQLTVGFLIKNEMLEVTVQDDGVGFNYNPDLFKLKGNVYGLFSIQERITDLGGRFIIDSVNEQGTKAILLVPLQNNLP